MNKYQALYNANKFAQTMDPSRDRTKDGSGTILGHASAHPNLKYDAAQKQLKREDVQVKKKDFGSEMLMFLRDRKKRLLTSIEEKDI